MNQELFTAVEHYINELFNTPEESQQHTLQAAQQAGLPTIQISPNQGKLLYLFALLSRARTILEIGTLAGYSAIWMARALPPDGTLITIDNNPHCIETARAAIAHAGVQDRVQLYLGDALETLTRLRQQAHPPFDMVFMDSGDKSQYTEYLAQILPLTRPGSLIIADNAVLQGDILDPNPTNANTSGIQHFNAALAADPRLTATIVPMAGTKGYDGLAVAVVKGEEP